MHTPCTKTDSELVVQLKDVSMRREAFSILVERYSRRLYWHIRHMVVSHEDADDILQDTFIKAWTHIDNFRADSQISTWLFRIAINESLTFLSHKKETIPIDTPNSPPVSMLESDPWFDGDEAAICLQKALASLPPKQRVVFNMKYFDNMKYEEMSKILETSVGALKASYHIAVKKIESILATNN